AAVLVIVAADYFSAITGPILFIAILGALAGLRWSFAPLVFALVGATFFALHSARIANTPGDELVQIAGAETRPANVIGIVTTEPKIEVTGNASFLLRLHKARINGQDFQTNATVFVRWRGRPNVGDELALFGTFQPIEPPRNPGEFDMRAYLARRDVKNLFIVRYPENGRILAPGSGCPDPINPLLFSHAAITGLHTDRARAAAKNALLLGGIFFDRTVLALNSLAAAALLILLFDSNQLFTSRFQLSSPVLGAIVL